VTAQGQPRLLVAHPAPVVGDADQPTAAAVDLDLDPPGPGVQGVLAQLLHHRGGPFHHLAGGDLIGQRGRQDGDARGARRGELDLGHGPRI